MPAGDRTRLNLHRKLDAVLGPEEADTLMAHLPPVTWNEVATKSDLEALEGRLRSEMHVGFADIRTEIAESANRQMRWMMTFVVAWTSVVIAAVRFLT